MVGSRKSGLKVLALSLGFLIVSVGVFLGIQFFTKTGIFKIPGVVKYDESLSEAEKAQLMAIFTEETVLDKDVTISARDESRRPELEAGEFLTGITVSVTDFYDTRNDTSEFDNVKKIPLDELDHTQKLLSVNGKYFLDTLDEGADYHIISFKSEKYDEEIRPLVEETFGKTFLTKDNVLSLAQTGVTALSRGMNEKLVNVGGDAKYFAAEIGDFLKSFDLTHTSNEASFSAFASKANICSDTRFIETLAAIGLDIVELTGNHNQDCGDEAAIETIDIYRENNIQIVGGGKTATEAQVPLQINQKNNHITMLAYNQSTGGATLDATPGANQYTEENAMKEIMEAKARGDTVIVDIQYYECAGYASEYEDNTCDYADSAAGDQVGFFRHLIDLGADVVVGTSAHQPQTYEKYHNGVIYYGLGNLFFDQIWWPGTTRSLVLAHYFANGKILQTRIFPTEYDSNMQTKLMDSTKANNYLKRLISVRPAGGDD